MPLLQPLRWRCVDCVIHRERDAREEQNHIYVARTSNNKVITACELCCLLRFRSQHRQHIPEFFV